MNGLLKHWQVHLMWSYITAIWQVKIHLHLWYTRGRASTLCSCLSVGLNTKVGVRETWPGALVIEMHVLSCQIQQTNIYSFHLNSFWQLRAPSTTNNPQTTNSFDGPPIADQSKSVCQQMLSTLAVYSNWDCEEFSIGPFFFSFFFLAEDFEKDPAAHLEKNRALSVCHPHTFFLCAIERSTTLSNFIAVTLCCHHWILQHVRWPL